MKGMTFIMKWIKKAAAMAAAAAMALSLSACENNLSWAAKIGDDTTVPVGLYIYQQVSHYRVGMQNGTLDSYTELSEQTVEVSGSDVAALDYLTDEAKKSLKSTVGVMLMSEEMNLSLTEEEVNSAVQSAADDYDQNEEALTKNGVAKTSVEEYYKDITRKNNLFQALYGKNGTKPVSDDELKAFYKANYATLNFMQQYFYKEDGSMMTDDEIAAVKKEYKSIRSKVQKGKLDFVKACEEASKDNSGYKGAYTDITQRFDAADEQGEKILSLKVGEFYLFETDTSIALIQKAKLNMDSKKFEEARSTLLIEAKYDAFVDEMIKYAENSDKVKFNDKAFDKFAASTRDFSELTVSTGSYY